MCDDSDNAYHREISVIPAGNYCRLLKPWKVTPVHLRLFERKPYWRRLVCYYHDSKSQPISHWQYADRPSKEHDYEV